MYSCSDKKTLRREMLKALRSYEKKEEESKLILDALIHSEEFQKAKTILAFSPMASEPDISPILADARVALPFIQDGKMEFSLSKDLKKSNMGFLEPTDKIAVEYDKALIIVPLVAFDNSLYRLGRGGGFYDRYIKENRDKLIAIGVAFSIQRVDILPIEDFDQRLDAVICP